MLVEAIAVDSFQHDEIIGVRGRAIQPPLEQSIAQDLERAGLVRINVPSLRDAPAAIASGKAQDDGTAQPSSALPAGQVLHATTLKSSANGAKRHRKAGK